MSAEAAPAPDTVPVTVNGQEVHVPKGAPSGHKLTFYEKADEIPDGVAGDLKIVLKEEPHAVFKRRGADLYIKKKISLMEALCGFTLEVEHLDKRKLIIKTSPGEVTQPLLFNPLKKTDYHSLWRNIIDKRKIY